MTKELPKAKCPPMRGDYFAPTLSIYGDVMKLTTSGTNGGNESGKTDPARKL